VNKRLESLLDRLHIRVAGDLHADVRPTELGVFDGAADYLEPHQRGSKRRPSILSELLRKRDLKPLRAAVDRVERRPLPVERERHDRVVIAVCMRQRLTRSLQGPDHGRRVRADPRRNGALAAPRGADAARGQRAVRLRVAYCFAAMSRRPNVLVVLTDQLRYPPEYESEELANYRREQMPGQHSLREAGVSFRHHYPIAAACAPSRASLLTGQYPSLHGVTQTDGLSKTADSEDMFWLAPDTVPTLGDWFRAGGYRTFFKGKWHASHAHLDAHDGDGYLLSIDDDGKPIEENIKEYLEADLLDEYGFSEWVGPEPHGLGKHNTGTVKDPFTADETIALLQRLDAEQDEQPWLTVCSFLNPHDDSLFGLFSVMQGLRFHPSTVPEVAQAPTREEDLSTKPACHQSYVDMWGKIIAPQPWVETHLKFYYQLQATVDLEINRVLQALRASKAFENTIVVFSSDHGDMQGAHGGMHEKWHVAYEEALRVPFVISSPLLPGGEREIDIPTGHADLLPTLLGFAGIDQTQALARLQADHADARSLVGRDLSDAVRAAKPSTRSEPVLFTTDDEISEGSVQSPSPFQRFARLAKTYATVVQPNHIETVVAEVEVDGEQHLVKFSRYHDNQQFWTVPGERDERLAGRKTITVTEPEPDDYELYDLTLDPQEERNLAHPKFADSRSRALQQTMLALLAQQIAAKRPHLRPARRQATGRPRSP
jgi:arylsulfatase A-like enzyme